jgi:hypothetical protein
MISYYKPYKPSRLYVIFDAEGGISLQCPKYCHFYGRSSEGIEEAAIAFYDLYCGTEIEKWVANQPEKRLDPIRLEANDYRDKTVYNKPQVKIITAEFAQTPTLFELTKKIGTADFFKELSKIWGKDEEIES